MYKREKMAAAFWIIIFAIFVGLTGGVNEKCRSFPYFVCAIGIVFSALQFANVCFKEKKNIPIDDPIPSMSREQLGTVALALLHWFDPHSWIFCNNIYLYCRIFLLAE